MKKINKIREEEERRKKEFLKRVEYEKLKRGITKRKEDYEEQKAKKYVRQINQTYEIFEPEKHIEITEGTKNEGKKHCSTKSQWKYKREELEKEGKVKPEIEEITEWLEKENKVEKIDPLERKENVLLIIKNYVSTKELKIRPADKYSYIEANAAGKKCLISIKKFVPDEKEIFNSKYGKLNGKDIIEISFNLRYEIYKVIDIDYEEEKEEEVKNERRDKIKYYTEDALNYREKKKKMPFTF